MSGEADHFDAAKVPPAEDDSARQVLAASRLIVGFVQGLALYLLYLATDNHAWPSTDPYWIAPLLMVFLFVPILFTQGVGTMRPRTLGLWIGTVTVVLALLAWFDVWRQWEPAKAGFDSSMTFAFVFFAMAGLFIAHALVTAADAERRAVASYRIYFEAAWKFGVQLALAAIFVGVFWAVLWLGAILFNLIKIAFIENLIERSWFAIPATTLATAAAIHVTDVRARLVAGIRTVALTLLAWLLPLMVLIGGGFTLSLPFTGLEPLWETRSAAGILLGSAGALVVLINAAFQDGDAAHNRPIVLRYAEFAAALILIPLVAIASYALWLRVAQYGWTVERVATAATILVAACYALGYALAAILSLRGGAWMVWIERVNIATAFVVLAVLLALFTPIADPARLAVNSQVARLQSGALDPHRFDFDYLKSEGGRYGHAALADLSAGQFGGNTALVRKMAKDVMNGVYSVAPKPSEVDITRNVTVYPSTRALPRNFAKQDWSKMDVPACLTNPDAKCDAFFANLDGDGGEDVVLVSGTDLYWSGTILQQGRDNIWRPVGSISTACPGLWAALKRGDAKPAAQHGWHDWVIRGYALHPVSNYTVPAPCPT